MNVTFGGVTYEGSSDAAEQHDAAAPAEIIDLNDPRLMSEDVTLDASADAYEMPPPPPDGTWRAKLKQVDVKDANGQLQRFVPKSYAKMANGRPFLVTNVESSLIDLGGKFDGVKVTEYHVKTLIDERKNTSAVATIVIKAGGTLSGKSDKAQMDSLIATLAGEPEVLVETYWEASCQQCQDTAKKTGQRSPRPFLTGMHRFPQGKGGADPVVKCPACGAQARAQVRIGRYLSVKEAKPTRGIS